MKNTMKRTLGLFAAALLTMLLALSVYASGHDLTFTDKGNRMHVKDKTVHVQTYYPYEYYVLDVLEDALVVANPEWDDCGFAVCRRITNEYLDYTGSDDDFVLDYAEEYLEYDFQQLYGGQWPDTSCRSDLCSRRDSTMMLSLLRPACRLTRTAALKLLQ